MRGTAADEIDDGVLFGHGGDLACAGLTRFEVEQEGFGLRFGQLPGHHLFKGSNAGTGRGDWHG
jgi:hypothetical protein